MTTPRTNAPLVKVQDGWAQQDELPDHILSELGGPDEAWLATDMLVSLDTHR